jgi:transposase
MQGLVGNWAGRTGVSVGSESDFSGNSRRVLNRIFWVLRSGAPWRDLPMSYDPRKTCYNRFVWWRQTGSWMQRPPAMTRRCR